MHKRSNHVFFSEDLIILTLDLFYNKKYLADLLIIFLRIKMAIFQLISKCFGDARDPVTWFDHPYSCFRVICPQQEWRAGGVFGLGIPFSLGGRHDG